MWFTRLRSKVETLCKLGSSGTSKDQIYCNFSVGGSSAPPRPVAVPISGDTTDMAKSTPCL